MTSLLSEIKAAIRGTDTDYTEGPLRRAIILLAVPMVLEMVMESLFAVVNIFWIAKLGADRWRAWASPSRCSPSSTHWRWG